MGQSRIPVIDLGLWLSGDTAARERTARRVDEALRTAGFLLITGHGVDPALRTRIREAARAFFRLPEAAKRPYAVRVGGRGWLGPGAEANAYADTSADTSGPDGSGDAPNPPDLKESLSFAAEEPTGDAAVDAEWFLPNTWPAEAPGLRPLVETYVARMRSLSDAVLELLAEALGVPLDFFTRHTRHPTWGFNINWYPGRDVVGEPEPGQFRIGPHTDFGTVTILDRQHGKGGLQVFTDEGGWEDAPYDPGAFTVNIGDLMARWTGDRWRSGRHRVLPPPADAPAEELMSLVYFYECDPRTRVESLPAPVGTVAYEPVDSHTYLRARLDAISAD
ncbi:2-oxoglutarate and iron-dependent oxygenase domain-containing protein [Streptomyces sp. NPDC047108]|uniref:isopenicillin N synthase family dioxygenase n=1 Tax=Streptomyces sp. NPDC047108 TaxID=3155025 RepID=UPI00340BAF5B